MVSIIEMSDPFSIYDWVWSQPMGEDLAFQCWRCCSVIHIKLTMKTVLSMADDIFKCKLSTPSVLSHWKLNKWPSFCRKYLNIFDKWKVLRSYSHFTAIRSWGASLQYRSIGSDKALVQTRRQAIIRADEDAFQWRMYGSVGLSEWIN